MTLGLGSGSGEWLLSSVRMMSSRPSRVFPLGCSVPGSVRVRVSVRVKVKVKVKVKVQG